MCKYCDKSTYEKGFELLYDNETEQMYVSVDKDNATLIFNYNNSDEFEIDVNYCPMCGKDLRGWHD